MENLTDRELKIIKNLKLGSKINYFGIVCYIFIIIFFSTFYALSLKLAFQFNNIALFKELQLIGKTEILPYLIVVFILLLYCLGWKRSIDDSLSVLDRLFYNKEVENNFKKHLGIKIIGIFLVIFASFRISLGIFYFIFREFSGSPADYWLLSFCIFYFLRAMGALGLLSLKEWGRKLTILSCLGAIFLVIVSFGCSLLMNNITKAVAINDSILLYFNLSIIYYLTVARIKEQFR